jgi:hypothetical protein
MHDAVIQGQVVMTAPDDGVSYGLGLFDEHQAILRASAIDVDVARERGYVSVTEKTRLEQAGFAKVQRRPPGLLIPVHGVTGDVVTPTRHGRRPPGRS